MGVAVTTGLDACISNLFQRHARSRAQGTMQIWLPAGAPPDAPAPKSARPALPGYQPPTRAHVTWRPPFAPVSRLVSDHPHTPPRPRLTASPQIEHPDARTRLASLRSLPGFESRLPRRRTGSGSRPPVRADTPPSPAPAPVQGFTKRKKEMGHQEAVVTQTSGTAPSPAKDQPALYPYVDWSTMQSYYAPGMLPPTFFGPGIASGHVPPPYMWGPQNLPQAAFGKPYAAIHPHTGAYLHPFMPLMVNPLNAELAKSVNSNENSLNKKLKEIEGTDVSTGSDNSEKTSWDCSQEGSSDGHNQNACGTPKKRRLDDMTTPVVETCGASAPNGVQGEPGRLATLPNLRITDTAIKPCASAGSDFRVSGTPSTEWPAKDDKESKRERRKQSNRESARRSRLRKQAETEELARKAELLAAENSSLRSEINKLTESSQKLRLQNSALMEKLTDAAPDEAPADQTAAAAPAPARVVKNFLSMMDGAAGAPRGGRRVEHGAPRLRQLLSSGPLAADAVAAN